MTLQYTIDTIDTIDTVDYRLYTIDYRHHRLQTMDYRLQTIDYRLYALFSNCLKLKKNGNFSKKKLKNSIKSF